MILRWAKGLTTRDRAILNQKLDRLSQMDFDLAKNTRLLAGPIYKHIYKLVIHGSVMLRPMLCRGPVNNEKEYTLLLGAIEVGNKLPADSMEKAEENRATVIADPSRSASMSEFLDNLKIEFLDEEYRYAYAEDFLNTSIATQISVLREQRELTQEELAARIGTKQPGVSRLENVNHSSWKTETLKRIARELGVWVKITFEPFSTLINDSGSFSRTNLQRVSFAEDPMFAGLAALPSIAAMTEQASQSQDVGLPFAVQEGASSRAQAA